MIAFALLITTSLFALQSIALKSVWPQLYMVSQLWI